MTEEKNSKLNSSLNLLKRGALGAGSAAKFAAVASYSGAKSLASGVGEVVHRFRTAPTPDKIREAILAECDLMNVEGYELFTCREMLANKVITRLNK